MSVEEYLEKWPVRPGLLSDDQVSGPGDWLGNRIIACFSNPMDFASPDLLNDAVFLADTLSAMEKLPTSPRAYVIALVRERLGEIEAWLTGGADRTRLGKAVAAAWIDACSSVCIINIRSAARDIITKAKEKMA